MTNEKEKFKTVNVKEGTFARLLMAKFDMSIKDKKTLSMDKVISKLLDLHKQD